MTSREVAPHEKRAVERNGHAGAGRVFAPYTDIYETERAVIVSMEVPGVDRNAVDIELNEQVLTVRGAVDASRYEGLDPVWSEHGVGSFVRTFRVSPKIDATAISAKLEDGVLTIELPKVKEAQLRRIAVN
jgi:HSP20 family protein